MAKSTFSGPIRSQDGFQAITTSSVGTDTTNSTYGTNATIGGTLTVADSINGKRKIDTTFNAAGAASATLTAAQSGTLFLINGAAANVITLPAVSTDNVGVHYDFQLTVAVGGSGKCNNYFCTSRISCFRFPSNAFIGCGNSS